MQQLKSSNWDLYPEYLDNEAGVMTIIQITRLKIVLLGRRHSRHDAACSGATFCLRSQEDKQCKSFTKRWFDTDVLERVSECSRIARY